MQGRYAAPPLPGKMARRDHHRPQPAGPAAAPPGVRADRGRGAGRPQGTAERDRRWHHQPGASESHGPAVLRGLAHQRAAGPRPEDSREEQVRPRAAADGHRQRPAAGPGRHRRRPGASRTRRHTQQLDGRDGAPRANPGDHAGAGEEPGAAERVGADRHAAGTAGPSEPEHDARAGHRGDRCRSGGRAAHQRVRDAVN